MRNTSEPPKMMVAMSEGSVAWLLSQKTSPGESLDDVVSGLRDLSNSAKSSCSEQKEIPKKTTGLRIEDKYSCSILGEQVQAQTVSELFGAVVDFMDDLCPEALIELAKVRPSNARRYIARERQNVHTYCDYLPVLQTKSGWWVSKNVSRNQVVSAIKALSRAAGLEFGKDICFPGQQS